MARPHDYSALPAHPAVGEKYKKKLSKYGRGTTVVAQVTCPICSAVREYPLYTLRQQMKRENFGGHCRACMSKLARAGAVRWRKAKYSKGSRRIHRSGYVMLGISSIADEDLALFKGLLNKGASVAEHRLVMSKHLGRPLTRQECVDHMDGNKQNNSLSNLRLYRMHTNDAGNTPGHGTYYHEWQMAETRVKDLQTQLDALTG